MDEIIKNYTNGEVTVVWKPGTCIHSTLCWKGLISVFNPKKKPWVNIEGAGTQEIIEQVKKCPSGALGHYMNAPSENKAVEIDTETIVEVMPDGPLMVYGNVNVKDAQGNKTQKNNVTAFCRCGQSSNKPYCDGTHRKTGFKG